MKPNSLRYSTAFCLLLLAQFTQAFNLKSLLFGDGVQDGGDSTTTTASASFGTPVTEYPRSSRSDITCSKYLCEETQDCVDTPIDCPCRLMTDKKCIIGDWYTCIRGDESCQDLL